MRICTVSEFGRERVIDWLRRGPLIDLYAVYDLTHDEANTRMQLAVEKDSIVGYLLSYLAFEYPVRILRGSTTAVKSLINEIPKEKMIAFIDHASLDLVKKNLRPTGIWPEYNMEVRKGQEQLHDTNKARRLDVEDAGQLASLYSKVRGGFEDSDLHRKNIAKHFYYGIFSDGHLVSVGGSYVETVDGWIIGAICTSPSFRNNGYAGIVTSALTEQALAETQRVGLNVISTNNTAIRLYEKLGFRKTGEWVLLDIGTGHKPLTN